MAERRMFSKSIIDSDAFIEMPQSSQNLYFHLSMRADDDGFINSPKKIQRMIGASDDDIRILCAKNFIIPFESGVVVIKHWRIHNCIQRDRYKPTLYTDEMSQLAEKENKAYTRISPATDNNGSNVYTLETQVRLGKVRLVEAMPVEEEKPKKPRAKSDKPPRHQSDFDEYWNSYPPTKNKVSKSAAYKAYVKKRDEGVTKEDLLAALEIYKEECKGFSDSKYIRCPHRTIEQYTPPIQPKKREEEPVLKRFEHHVMLQMRLRDDGDAHDSALIDLYMDRESDEAMEAYAKKWAETGDWR